MPCCVLPLGIIKLDFEMCAHLTPRYRTFSGYVWPPGSRTDIGHNACWVVNKKARHESFSAGSWDPSPLDFGSSESASQHPLKRLTAVPHHALLLDAHVLFMAIC